MKITYLGAVDIFMALEQKTPKKQILVQIRPSDGDGIDGYVNLHINLTSPKELSGGRTQDPTLDSNCHPSDYGCQTPEQLADLMEKEIKNKYGIKIEKNGF